jgi:hypothetical protein
MISNLAQASAFSRPKAQGAAKLEQTFRTVSAESCPRLYNFHMHTVCSDGQLEPEALMQQAIELNLQEFAITDHHSVSGYYRAQAWYEDWQWRNPTSQIMGRSRRSAPRLWTGVEINAGLLDTEVHILGYAFDPDHPCIQPYLQRHARSRQDPLYRANQVIASIQASGGLAVLAHPARYRRSPEDLIPEAARLGINGVEAYYAYDNPLPWRPSPQRTERIKRLAKRHNLLSTCGTDTHGRSLLRRL